MKYSLISQQDTDKIRDDRRLALEAEHVRISMERDIAQTILSKTSDHQDGEKLLALEKKLEIIELSLQALG